MEKKTKKPPIPTKPSAIIREQIAALKWARKQKGVKIDMTTWCTENDDGTCSLCEAGAWYAQRYGLEKLRDADTNGLMQAMDEFREGRLGSAYDELGRNQPDIIANSVEIADYYDSPARHIRDMLKLADQLEALGE